MEIIIYVAIALVALLVGAGVTMAINKSLAKSRANSIIEEAKLEAEVLKKNKILEAKEEGVAIKAEAEKIQETAARSEANLERAADFIVGFLKKELQTS